MKQIKTILFIFIACGISFAKGAKSASNSMLPATIPCGILYPAFAQASLSNAASLAMDWRTELQALYSPPLRPEDPYSYLVGFATSDNVLGLNAGYSGSTQAGTTFHSGYAGGAYHYGPLAGGLSLRGMDTALTTNFSVDLSLIYQLERYVRLGIVGYDLTDDRQMGLGIGVGKQNQFILEADFLAPMSFNQQQLASEYAASLSAVYYLGFVGASAGYKYSKVDYLGGAETRNSYFAAAVLKITNGLNAVAQYESEPKSIAVGITWSLTPPGRKRVAQSDSQTRSRRSRW